MIPASNIKHLMLRQDVIDAMSADKFHIYAVETIDEGIQILTRFPAGERDESCRFPDDTFNQNVERPVLEFAEQVPAFHGGAGLCQRSGS